MEQNISLILLFLLPFAGAFLVYACRKSEKTAQILAVTVAAAEFLLAFCTGVSVLGGKEFVFAIKDFASFGLHFKMDSFRAVYLTITAFMWLTAVVFSPEYMRHHENKARYYFFTFLTLGATAGVFLSADLMTTFIFFEMMSFTSYVWVVQEETKAALRAAETYLAVAVIGGMVMLMGIFLLYHMTGTFDLAELKTACAAVENRGLLRTAGCLMLFGFGAKAGMFPLHIWLPKAHPVAPAPASALLSGVLTKSGIFGIILISGSILTQDRTFGWIVLILGTITMFLGALLGVFSIDLKRTFACSSVSQVGFILTGLGMMNLMEENVLAVHGAFLHMINHSLIKLVLFLLAGVVYQNLHTLDLTAVKGFGKKKPFFLLAYLSGALAIGGIPFFSGYISKTMLHEAIVEGSVLFAGNAAAGLKAVEWIFLVSGGMTIAYMLKIFVVLFVDKPSEQVKAKTGSYLSLPVKVLLAVPMALFLVMGILPQQIMQPLAGAAEKFFYGASAAMEEETVRFFSFTNLKGAGISLLIGLLLYFGVVRTWMIVKKEGKTEYVNRIPGWLDLENLIYRPLFVHLLPFLCAVICRLLDKLVTFLALLLSNTVLSEKRPKEDLYVGNRLTYAVGRGMDFISYLLNRTVRRKHPVQRSYVKLLAVGSEEISRTGRLIARSVSYGLMLSCIGLLLTMLYLLV